MTIHESYYNQACNEASELRHRLLGAESQSMALLQHIKHLMSVIEDAVDVIADLEDAVKRDEPYPPPCDLSGCENLDNQGEIVRECQWCKLEEYKHYIKGLVRYG